MSDVRQNCNVNIRGKYEKKKLLILLNFWSYELSYAKWTDFLAKTCQEQQNPEMRAYTAGLNDSTHNSKLFHMKFEVGVSEWMSEHSSKTEQKQRKTNCA